MPGTDTVIRPVVADNHGWLVFLGGGTLLLMAAVGPFGIVSELAVFLLLSLIHI